MADPKVSLCTRQLLLKFSNYVFITEKPPAPNFQLESTTPTSITVSITPGVSGVKGYRLQYSLQSGGKKDQENLGPGDEHVLDGNKMMLYLVLDYKNGLRTPYLKYARSLGYLKLLD